MLVDQRAELAAERKRLQVCGWCPGRKGCGAMTHPISNKGG
jgi:hypothetical protein